MSDLKLPMHGRNHRPGGSDPIPGLEDLFTTAGFHGCRAQLGARITGTVSKTSGNTTITGSGTQFLTELIVGYSVHIPGGGGDDFVTIQSITNDNAFVATVAPTNSASGQTAEMDLPIPNTTFTPVKYQDDRFGAGHLIYDTDNYHFHSSATLTGTVSKTVGDTMLGGSGTQFLSELSVNQCIDVPGGGGTDILVVKRIVNNTSLEVWNPPLYTASGQTSVCNPTCFAIPAGLSGYYGINLLDDWRWDSDGVREGNIVVNNDTSGIGFFRGIVGGAYIRAAVSPQETAYTVGEIGVYLNEGDFVQNHAYQDSGATLNMTPLSTFELWLRGQPDTGYPGPAGIDGVNGTDGVQGGAVVINYTFSTTTTDSDPGNGNLRLSNATQNASTAIRADHLSSDGTDWSAVLTTLDDSTNTVKGHVRLFKADDPTKWLLFTVSAVGSESGYKNITVANVGSSSANPFANGDAIVLCFDRAGDEGSTGGGIPTDGWVDDTGTTWTYASATTFTVSGDVTAIFRKGLKLKLTQTTVKYFYVVASSHAGGTTTVTITGGSDYSLANAAITANYYSPVENPEGFPDWFNYTPTATSGFSGSLTVTSARFRLSCKTCTCEFNVSGTSNSTTDFRFTMPVTSASLSGNLMPGWCRITNNGTLQSAAGYCTANNSGSGGETSFQVYRDGASTAYTSSGTKAAVGVCVYEI